MGVQGLSPGGTEGQRVPKKMVKNEVLPQAFQSSFISYMSF